MDFATWADLGAELDQWAGRQRTATFWWRDDDATTWTPALERQLHLAGETPIALAVVPKGVDESLERALRAFPLVSVLTHGWSHRNHEPEGAKKNEFGSDRPLRERRVALATGRSFLRLTFGARAVSVLVPPWNRIAEDLLPHLPKLGFVGLSTIKPRSSAEPVPGLRAANVHVDLTDWSAGRAFAGEGPVLAGVVRHLRQRRTAQADAAEPTGILTHHLIQDDAADRFLVRFLEAVRRHPAARFLGAPQVFELS